MKILKHPFPQRRHWFEIYKEPDDAITILEVKTTTTTLKSRVCLQYAPMVNTEVDYIPEPWQDTYPLIDSELLISEDYIVLTDCTLEEVELKCLELYPEIFL